MTDWFLYDNANQWTGFYMITASVMKGLSIADLDYTLRRGSQSNLRNFTVNESEAIEVVPPRDSGCIFDTMSIMRSLKAKEIYEKWFDQIMKQLRCRVNLKDPCLWNRIRN